MKKLISFLLCMAMILSILIFMLSLTGCQGVNSAGINADNEAEKETGKLNIITNILILTWTLFSNMIHCYHIYQAKS